MIFLTVGTLFPFDRLVKTVDRAISDGLITLPVFAQIGSGKYRPQSMEYVETLDKIDFDAKIKNSVGLISHAGMGSITMALHHRKPLIVMPRLKKFKEHVNDHQLGTAKKFEKLGHVLALYHAADLPRKIEAMRDFVPEPRVSQPDAVAKRISDFIATLE
jgi:UDP-N-acetylglucosamine transferase subunit ALG13